VDGELWDLERPLEKSIRLELLDFEHAEGDRYPFLVYLSCLPSHQGRRSSGILLRMYLGRPPKGTTDAIYASVPRRTMVSFMRWQLMIGNINLLSFASEPYMSHLAEWLRMPTIPYLRRSLKVPSKIVKGLSVCSFQRISY